MRGRLPGRLCSVQGVEVTGIWPPQVVSPSWWSSWSWREVLFLTAKATEAKSATHSCRNLGPLRQVTAHSTVGPLPQGPQAPTLPRCFPSHSLPLMFCLEGFPLGAASHSLPGVPHTCMCVHAGHLGSSPCSPSCLCCRSESATMNNFFSSVDGQLELLAQATLDSTVSSMGALHALRPRLSHFHQILLTPPEVGQGGCGQWGVGVLVLGSRQCWVGNQASPVLAAGATVHNVGQPVPASGQHTAACGQAAGQCPECQRCGPDTGAPGAGCAQHHAGAVGGMGWGGGGPVGQVSQCQPASPSRTSFSTTCSTTSFTLKWRYV